MIDWEKQIDDAKKASMTVKLLDGKTRRDALIAISEKLKNNKEKILEANKIDCDNAKELSDVMQKRLALTKETIEKIANDVIAISELDDPINQVLDERVRPNGLIIQKISVPLGVIAAVYESRPNVSVDIASLCVKTGNVCILKGGKEAFRTNTVLVDLMREAIKPYMDSNAITLISNNSREVVKELITRKNDIDLVVPRGGKGLIKYVTENAKVPFIETGAGVCHIYLDYNLDMDMAMRIINNAKTSNPAVCNAVECILINEKIAKEALENISCMFNNRVKLCGDQKVKDLIDCELINDYGNEYDDLILDLRIVSSLDEAIEHIEKYGTHHSDVIVSNEEKNISCFLETVDSACVYVNASPRFTDGGCFGMGAELGISTQKLHARGPMALHEMTTYKYKIYGKGQIR